MFCFQMWAIINSNYKKKPHLLTLLSTQDPLRFATKQQLSIFIVRNLSKIFTRRHRVTQTAAEEKSTAQFDFQAQTQHGNPLALQLFGSGWLKSPFGKSCWVLSPKSEPCAAPTGNFHFHFPFPLLHTLRGALTMPPDCHHRVFFPRQSPTGWATEMSWSSNPPWHKSHPIHAHPSCGHSAALPCGKMGLIPHCCSARDLWGWFIVRKTETSSCPNTSREESK